MVELKLGLRTVDLPYMVRIADVTERMFDRMVDEDTKAELIDGVMIVHSPASPEHDDVSGFIRMLLRIYVEEKKLGKVLGPDSLIRVAELRQFAPDWYFVERARVPSKLPKKYPGAAAMVGEVLSPSNREYDLDEKRALYQEEGIEEIWVIDPQEQKVLVDKKRRRSYASTVASRGRVSSTAVPGFWIQAEWLWSDPLPPVLACYEQIAGSR